MAIYTPPHPPGREKLKECFNRWESKVSASGGNPGFKTLRDVSLQFRRETHRENTLQRVLILSMKTHPENLYISEIPRKYGEF